MADLIILAIVALIIGVAVAYIVKAKKSGVKCIGCPHGGTCGKCASGGCGCDGCGGCGCQKE